MAALNLHRALFSAEKHPDLPLRSATLFLHPASGRGGSPASPLFASAAYQDLIQRQPTHPDGPTLGWDLGLNLLGDPLTPAEHKSLEDRQIKIKLRRLRALNLAFELLFGIWAAYTTVRYSLAFATDSGDTEHVFALALGIISAIALALVVTSFSMPLFPRHIHPHAWRHTRSLLRACYLLLLSASAMMNVVLVLLWHPDHLCHWDLDISWYISAANTVSSPCHTAPFAAWTAAATLRLVVTSTMALFFIYVARVYYGIRHPSERIRTNYSSYLPSDPEDIDTSPVSTPSPLTLSKSPLKLTLSEDSNHSDITLVKSKSISTLAPSVSCTGHSRSQSASRKDISSPRISPPTSRRISTHASDHAPTTGGPETSSQTQPVMSPPSTPPMLRRTSRNSVTRVTISSDTSSHPEELDGPTSHSSSQTESSSTSGGESTKETDDDVVYSYGYGASGRTYPYLNGYNPRMHGRNAQAACEDVHSPAGPPPFPEVSEPPSSSSSTTKDDSSEEEQYVAMMGGFVRRMATIESVGSKEARTLSTGRMALHSVRSKSPASEFSSVRFASCTSTTSSSLGLSVSRYDSLSTAYLSLSSGGTGSMGMRANERGELLPGHSTRMGAAG